MVIILNMQGSKCACTYATFIVKCLQEFNFTSAFIQTINLSKKGSFKKNLGYTFRICLTAFCDASVE